MAAQIIMNFAKNNKLQYEQATTCKQDLGISEQNAF